MFVNRMPRYEILSEDAVATLDRGWRRIVSEIGVEFVLPEAVEIFAKAGQKTDGQNVMLDPDFVMEQVAKAPREFDVQARNPEHDIHLGGEHMVFASVYGPPFVREGDTRSDATIEDFRRFAMLSQHFPQLDSAGGTICEPNDTPLDSRHLDMVLRTADADRQAVHGLGHIRPERRGHDPHERDPVRRARGDRGDAGVDLADQRQLPAALRRPDAGGDDGVRARRPARRDHAVPADGRHVAGHRSRPRSPSSWPRRSPASRWRSLCGRAHRCMFGSFLSNTDMQSGSPSFGTPESALGLLCTGQLARHYGLPFRSGGALTASQTVDAQAAVRGDDDDAAHVPGGRRTG